MKQFIFTTILLLGFSSFAYGQGQPDGAAEAAPASGGVSDPSISSGSITRINESANIMVTENSNQAAYQNYMNAFESAGVSHGQLEDILESVSSMSTPGEAASLLGAVREAASQCERFVKTAQQCCTQPESCGGGGANKFGGFAKSAAQMAPMIAGLMGNGGAASCLQALPGLVDNLSFSKGMSKACKMLRDGPNYQGSKQPKKGIQTGCSQVCQTANQIVTTYISRVTQMRNEAPELATYASQASNEQKTVNQARNVCSSSLTQAEQKADQQTAENKKAQMGAIQCAKDFMNDDEEVAEEEEQQPNIQDPAYDPLQMGNDGGASGKVTYDNGGIGGPTTDGTEFDEDIDEERGVAGTGQKAGNSSGNAGIPFGAGGGGLSGSGGGIQENDDGQGGAGGAARKKDSLIGGYGKARGGGGSGYKAGSGGKKKWKSYFSDQKKKKNKDKAGLAALNKMAKKAAISMDASGNIFEKSTNRFNAEIVKKDLFDAPRNKKHWMDKK